MSQIPRETAPATVNATLANQGGLNAAPPSVSRVGNSVVSGVGNIAKSVGTGVSNLFSIVSISPSTNRSTTNTTGTVSTSAAGGGGVTAPTSLTFASPSNFSGIASSATNLFSPSTSGGSQTVSTNASIANANVSTTQASSGGTNLTPVGTAVSRGVSNLFSSSGNPLAGGGVSTNAQGGTVINAPAAALSLVALSRSGNLNGGTIANAAASAIGLNTNMPPSQALNVIAPGLTNAISSTISGAIAGGVRQLVNLADLKFLNLQLPALGKIAAFIGAGPKWLAQKLAEMNLIVPPFVPGLKINMAMVGAIISLIKAAANGQLGELAKSILADILEDIQEQSGLNELRNQIENWQDTVGLTAIQKDIENIASTIENAQSNFISAYNSANPPKKETDPETGDIIETPAPPPDLSVFTDTKNLLLVGTTSSSGGSSIGAAASSNVRPPGG